MEWVARNGIRPAVASMSLGGSGSRIQDDAVKSLYDSGVTVVVAAGNDDDDACLKSPARAPHVCTNNVLSLSIKHHMLFHISILEYLLGSVVRILLSFFPPWYQCY